MISWSPDSVQRFLGAAPDVQPGDPDLRRSFAIPLRSGGEARLEVDAFEETVRLNYTPSPGSPEIYGVLRCTKIEIEDDPEDGEWLVMSGPLGSVSISRQSEGLGLTFGLYVPEGQGAEKQRPRNGLRDAVLFIAGAAAASLLLLLLNVWG